jgi:death-on-curing protein
VTTSPAASTETASPTPPTGSQRRTPTLLTSSGSDAPVKYLDLDDLLELAARLLGDPPPIRDIGLLGSAVARPQTSAFGRDAYPNLWTKAAALLQSIVNGHALIDGNKRLGWLATAVFLDINHIHVSEADNDDVYRLVMHVAAGDPSIEEIARQLQRLCQTSQP